MRLATASPQLPDATSDRPSWRFGHRRGAHKLLLCFLTERPFLVMVASRSARSRACSSSIFFTSSASGTRCAWVAGTTSEPSRCSVLCSGWVRSPCRFLSSSPSAVWRLRCLRGNRSAFQRTAGPSSRRRNGQPDTPSARLLILWPSYRRSIPPATPSLDIDRPSAPGRCLEERREVVIGASLKQILPVSSGERLVFRSFGGRSIYRSCPQAGSSGAP